MPPFAWVGLYRTDCNPMYSFAIFTWVLWRNPREHSKFGNFVRDREVGRL